MVHGPKIDGSPYASAKSVKPVLQPCIETARTKRPSSVTIQLAYCVTIWRWSRGLFFFAFEMYSPIGNFCQYAETKKNVTAMNSVFRFEYRHVMVASPSRLTWRW